MDNFNNIRVAMAQKIIDRILGQGYNNYIVNSPLIVNGPSIRAQLRSGDFCFREKDNEGCNSC